MKDSDVIDMRPIKAKLYQLADTAESQHESAFARYMASYFNDELYPEGIVMGLELMMYDLSIGKSSRPSVKLDGCLTGLPLQIYAILREFTAPDLLRKAGLPEAALNLFEV